MLHKSALLHECDHHVQIILKTKDVTHRNVSIPSLAFLRNLGLISDKRIFYWKLSSAEVNMELLFIVFTESSFPQYNKFPIKSNYPLFTFLMHHIIKVK